MMECKEIRKKLCPYLEKVIPPDEIRLVEEHLNACGECRVHLEDLKKTADLLKDLPEVEPPAWLTPKILFRIREEEEREKGLWPKLFRLRHLKVPLEALAVVFIAVIAVYLFKAIDPEMQPARLPAPPEAVIPREEGPQPARDAAANSPASSEKPSAKKHAEIETGKASPLFPGSREEGEKKEDKPALSGSALRPQAAERKEEARAGAALSAAAKDSPERKKLSAASKAKGLAVIKPASITIPVQVQKVDIAENEIQSLLAGLGARNMARESLEGRKVVTAELESFHIKIFLARLKAIGEVDEKGLPADITEREITIRVEIFPGP